MAKRVRKPKTEKKPIKIELETFRNIGTYEVSWMTQNEPSTFGKSVRIRKYKITVEVMDEPESVLCERLQSLWEKEVTEDNRGALMYEARKLGYELEGEMGDGWNE